MEIDGRLSEVLSEFARTLVTDFPIQAILDHLVVRIVDVLPVSGAGVTLISPGVVPRYVAASDDAALRFEQLQTDLGEGPCLVAYETGEAVTVPDLRRDSRFAQFSSRARDAGLVAVFTFPLRHGADRLGALDLYRASAGPLNSHELEAAQTLADVAAAYLLNAKAREDLKMSSELAHHTSLHDSLTGLPNRTLLVQRLDHAILRCRRSEKMVAILFADLDRFKSVNDTHGHHVGDQLLTAVGERLTRVLRPGDTLARLAGDEFVILCEDLDEASQVEPIAARIDASFTEPFVISGSHIRVSASVGIAFAGHGDDVPEQVLQEADTAMYQAKRKGGAGHGILDLREQRQSHHRASVNHELPGALTRGELRTEYQPIVATASGRITGVEALLRWEHPTLGIVPTGTVVQVAEQSGLINEIGRWVLERACLDRKRWQRDDHGAGPDICVNVSTHQLMSPDFVATVEAVLADTDTAAELVTLEMTESVFIHDSQRALAVLNDLKHLGLTLALDDFGTGYSSLSYLMQLPVDIVKIDRSFIANLDREPTSHLIVGAVVGLAHRLRMRVVAEGVESPDQCEQVAALECDSYQGFYFARPTTAEHLETLMAG